MTEADTCRRSAVSAALLDLLFLCCFRKMVNSCGIVTCKNSSTNFEGFYSFPSDTGTREVWCENTGIKAENVKKSTRVCKIHFLQSDFAGKKKLKSHAYPTLHLPTTVGLFMLFNFTVCPIKFWLTES